MPEDYTVRSGDCMSSLAFDRGFIWETLWNHPKNADLKSKRRDPNILLEGDVVWIPDLTLKHEPRATEKRHRFKLKGTPAKLRLRILEEPVPEPPSPPPVAPTGPVDTRHVATEDPPYEPRALKDRPRANIPFILDIDGKITNGKTDGDGRIECSIPPNARRGTLILEPGTPKETIIPLQLGHLDPVTEIRGVKNRLINLGFDCGDCTDDVTPQFTLAVSAFQEKHRLRVTGQVDQRTRDKLREAHGS
jgi:hypothetical protein